MVVFRAGLWLPGWMWPAATGSKGGGTSIGGDKGACGTRERGEQGESSRSSHGLKPELNRKREEGGDEQAEEPLWRSGGGKAGGHGFRRP